MIEEGWGDMSAGKRCKPETGKLTVALLWAQVLGWPWNLRVLENCWFVL